MASSSSDYWAGAPEDTDGDAGAPEDTTDDASIALAISLSLEEFEIFSAPRRSDATDAMVVVSVRRGFHKFCCFILDKWKQLVSSLFSPKEWKLHFL